MSDKSTKGRYVFVEQGTGKMEYAAFLIPDLAPRGSLHQVVWEGTGEREWVQETQIRFPEDTTRGKRARRQPVWWHSEEQYQCETVDDESSVDHDYEQAADQPISTTKKAAKPKSSTKKKKAKSIRPNKVIPPPTVIQPKAPYRNVARKSKAGGPPPALRRRRLPPRILDDEKKVLLLQFRSRYPYCEKGQVEEILQEYLRFLILKMDRPNYLYTPSPLVCGMWQSHIICSKEYFKFLERYNDGLYIHYDPTIMADNDRYALTLGAYRDKFQREPTDSVWPAQLSKSGQVALNSMHNRCIQDSGRNEDQSQESSSTSSDKSDTDSNNDKGSFASSSFELNLDSISGCDKGHNWLGGDYDTDCSGCQRAQDDL